MDQVIRVEVWSRGGAAVGEVTVRMNVETMFLMGIAGYDEASHVHRNCCRSAIYLERNKQQPMYSAAIQFLR